VNSSLSPAFFTSILAGPPRRLDANESAEPPLSQIIDMLQQVMCTHDAENALSVLEIYEGGEKTIFLLVSRFFD